MVALSAQVLTLTTIGAAPFRTIANDSAFGEMYAERRLPAGWLLAEKAICTVAETSGPVDREGAIEPTTLGAELPPLAHPPSSTSVTTATKLHKDKAGSRSLGRMESNDVFLEILLR